MDGVTSETSKEARRRMLVKDIGAMHGVRGKTLRISGGLCGEGNGSKSEQQPSTSGRRENPGWKACGRQPAIGGRLRVFPDRRLTYEVFSEIQERRM